MKKRFIIKTMLCCLLTAVLALSALSAACAGTSVSGQVQAPNGRSESELAERLRKIVSFKFWNFEDGIGYGNCPVYTAPSENAYRCANGKASCSTDSSMGEAGFVSGWLMVRYNTNNGGERVGYIPPRYVEGYQAKMRTPAFDYIPAVAADTLYVTDNTKLSGSAFAVLDPGETFYFLAKYTYFTDWWYIECTVDGRVARGFIDRAGARFFLGDGSGEPLTFETLGNPPVSPLGTAQTGTVTVEYGNGERKMVRKDANPNTDVVSAVYPERTYPCYAAKRGSTGKDWYYIWVEQDSVFGWVSSAFSSFMPLQ